MIRLAAFLDTAGGWTRHAHELAQALNRYERTELVDCNQWHTPQPAGRFREWRRRRSNSVGISMGAIEQTHALDTRYRVAFCIWETTSIPGPTLFSLTHADMVWTMSKWGREILLAHGVRAENIGIVPAGVDTEMFAPPPNGRPTASPFRFLCAGKWEERKGTALLVRAFAEEFDPSEPVELVLHCGAGWKRQCDYRTEASNVLAAAGRKDARIIFSDPVDKSRYAALMQNCHAFVLPTRAEGWGLPILEATRRRRPADKPGLVPARA